MICYALALASTVLTPCNAVEAQLQAVSLTSYERKAGYHVVMVEKDEFGFVTEMVDVEGFFDEV